MQNMVLAHHGRLIVFLAMESVTPTSLTDGMYY